MKIYFAGNMEILYYSKQNILWLDIEMRLLSYFYIKDVPNELYLLKGEIYEGKQK